MGKKKQKLSIGLEVKISDPKNVCSICHQPKLSGNELEQAGKFFRLDNDFFHYFCLLFSRKIQQKGDDDEGIYGFLSDDIKKGLLLANNLKCIYCRLGGASGGCKRCSKNFHFTCGYKNSAAFVFIHNMDSYCKDHAPVQKNPKLKITDRTCLAGCQEIVKKHDRSLVSPCCGRIFHIACLQQMALHAGQAHFKCPLCSEKSKFAREAKNLAVYIPETDASWENPEYEGFYNFQQMGQPYSQCDVQPSCLCPHGRSYNKVGTLFEIIRCENCGSSGAHIRCGRMIKSAPFYVCPAHNGHMTQMAAHKKEAKKRLRDANIYISDNESENEGEPCQTNGQPEVVEIDDHETVSRSSRVTNRGQRKQDRVQSGIKITALKLVSSRSRRRPTPTKPEQPRSLIDVSSPRPPASTYDVIDIVSSDSDCEEIAMLNFSTNVTLKVTKSFDTTNGNQTSSSSSSGMKNSPFLASQPSNDSDRDESLKLRLPQDTVQVGSNSSFTLTPVSKSSDLLPLIGATFSLKRWPQVDDDNDDDVIMLD